MINNKRRKITAIFMAAVVAVNLVGCSFKSEKRENKEVLEYLENKYDKKFEISEHLERVGAGPFKPQEFKRGKAYCTDNQLENFDVILYDDGLCKDNYQNIIMKSYSSDYYQEFIESYWDNVKIFMRLKHGENDKKFNEKEYLNKSGVSARIYVYIKINEDFNLEKESEKIYYFLNEFTERNLKGEILFIYVTDEIEAKDSNLNDKEVWSKYKDSGFINNYFGIIINNKGSLKSIDEIRKELEES